MLLSQQGQLVRLDANRAVVQVAGNWMGMVQSRTALLEQAIAKALGGSRQLILESQSNAMPPAPVVTSPVVTPQAPQTQQPDALKPPSAQKVVNAAPAQPLEHNRQRLCHSLQLQQSVKCNQHHRHPVWGTSNWDRTQAKNLADFFNGQVIDVNLMSRSAKFLQIDDNSGIDRVNCLIKVD